MKIKKDGHSDVIDLSDRGLEKATKEILIGPEEGAPNFVLRRFTLESGGCTPFHAHDWEHEVFILQGNGKLRSKDGDHEIKSGDSVFVSTNEKHQFHAGEEGMQFLCIVPKRGEED